MSLWSTCPHFPFAPALCNCHSVVFLGVWLFLFKIAHISDIIQYFPAWLISLSTVPSRFMHVVKMAGLSFLWLKNISLCGCVSHSHSIHPSTGTQVVLRGTWGCRYLFMAQFTVRSCDSSIEKISPLCLVLYAGLLSFVLGATEWEPLELGFCWERGCGVGQESGPGRSLHRWSRRKDLLGERQVVRPGLPRRGWCKWNFTAASSGAVWPPSQRFYGANWCSSHWPCDLCGPSDSIFLISPALLNCTSLLQLCFSKISVNVLPADISLFSLWVSIIFEKSLRYVVSGF